METGYKNTLGKINRENSGHIRQRVYKVEAADVDLVSYFAENIGVSVKKIEFYDINNNIIKVTIFTYGSVAGDNLAVKNIYTVYDDKNFSGTWAINSTPPISSENDWKFIDSIVTINSVSYKEGDIIAYINNPEEHNKYYSWRKCVFNGKGKLIPV